MLAMLVPVGGNLLVEQYDVVDGISADPSSSAEAGVDADHDSMGAPDDFWLHIGPNGATMGRGSIRAEDTVDTYGQLNEL